MQYHVSYARLAKKGRLVVFAPEMSEQGDTCFFCPSVTRKGQRHTVGSLVLDINVSSLLNLLPSALKFFISPLPSVRPFLARDIPSEYFGRFAPSIQLIGHLSSWDRNICLWNPLFYFSSGSHSLRSPKFTCSLLLVLGALS